MLDLVSGTFILSVLFALIRNSRRWWIWLWILSLPMQLLFVFVLPLVVDPMFNHFEPLARTNPALVQQLERVVAKTGVSIPPSRMFLMKASEKYTSSNAYVTGFGSSRRVVVWDNTIKSSPTDETLLVFGHELGHYVLHHIERGMAIGAVLSFFFLWIGALLAQWLVRRYGPRWHIASLKIGRQPACCCWCWLSSPSLPSPSAIALAGYRNTRRMSSELRRCMGS